MIRRVCLYFNTIRFLRFQQIIGQIYLRIRTQTKVIDRLKKKKKNVKFPGYRDNLEIRIGIEPPVPSQCTKALQEGRFFFLNQGKDFRNAIDWEPSELPKLWVYNLHYHDWLWSLTNEGWERAIELTTSWIESSKNCKKSAGWEPYPLSLRAQNWILLYFFLYRKRLEMDSRFREKLWVELFQQICYLERNIEHHILANHILENTVALCMAGINFHGKDAKRWRRKGIKLLKREVAEQVGKDGFHYEGSPMYHARVCWLLSALQKMGDKEVSVILGDIPSKLRTAKEHVRHPDGKIALMNDSSHDIYELGVPNPKYGPWALRNVGYYGYRGEEVYAICDGGGFGPRYQPGHVHADALSFELSILGKRLICDTGVYSYIEDEERAYSRSTRAHNTIEVEGADQGEMWGAFRVARSWKGSTYWQPLDDGFRLDARHDGYRRLRCGVVHKRVTTLRERERSIVIEDTLEGHGSYDAVYRLHFSPEIYIEEIDNRRIHCYHSDKGRLVAKIEFYGREDWGYRVIRSNYYPKFGIRLKRPCLELMMKVDGVDFLRTNINWLVDEDSIF